MSSDRKMWHAGDIISGCQVVHVDADSWILHVKLVCLTCWAECYSEPGQVQTTAQNHTRRHR